MSWAPGIFLRLLDALDFRLFLEMHRTARCTRRRYTRRAATSFFDLVWVFPQTEEQNRTSRPSFSRCLLGMVLLFLRRGPLLNTGVDSPVLRCLPHRHVVSVGVTLDSVDRLIRMLRQDLIEFMFREDFLAGISSVAWPENAPIGW